jgi:hypothetical protein
LLHHAKKKLQTRRLHLQVLEIQLKLDIKMMLCNLEENPFSTNIIGEKRFF